jgi:hypothetical protein
MRQTAQLKHIRSCNTSAWGLNDLNFHTSVTFTDSVLCGPPYYPYLFIYQLKQIPPRLPRCVHQLHYHPSYTSNQGHSQWQQMTSTLWIDKVALFVTWLWRLGIVLTGTAKILERTHPFQMVKENTGKRGRVCFAVHIATSQSEAMKKKQASYRRLTIYISP